MDERQKAWGLLCLLLIGTLLLGVALGWLMAL